MGDADDVSSNRELQAEEREVLAAIYGDDFDAMDGCSMMKILIRPPDDVEPPAATSAPLPPLSLLLHIPETYPATSAPIAELDAPWLTDEMKGRVCSSLEEMGREGARVEGRGEVAVFQWIEWIKEQDWLWQEAAMWQQKQQPRQQAMPPDEKPSIMSNPRDVAPQLAVSADVAADVAAVSMETILAVKEQQLQIVHGAPFTEKRSTFQAHLAPVTSLEAVHQVIAVLLSNKKIASATHNIMAYRIMPLGKTTTLQDCDDDGESAAGGRLLHLLQIVDAKNVLVVVSRWFGGILLGPDRFRHINNAARSLLVECGFVHQQQQQGEKGKSKRRT